ncbi:Transmembrane protein [Parasponia andersonii]|uniref:Transmembrane protein n=1 Tax=Parasponia andersonii TaxID=3476 RepID=A0A2P5AM13_PARAD|nr:Transmembrane protein [Parasponia andersonii]
MFSTLKLQVSNPAINTHCNHTFAGNISSDRFPYDLSLPARRRSSFSVKSEYVVSAGGGPSVPSHFTATVGTPSLSSSSSLQLARWNLTHRHVVVLNVVACAVAVSASWLFCSAIPALLAFKRAAESLEKLMDVMREELPDTMAAVRLSGMEISDLTMELSDLGQEITQGVRSSTRAVRVAEERLRGLTNMTPTASLQEVTNSKTKAVGPPLASTVRGVREGIVKGRALWQMFFTITRFSRLALDYLANRKKWAAR